MDSLDLESGAWNAVKVGPETVGWIGPNRPFARRVMSDVAIADITILMGDSRFSLDVVNFVFMRFILPEHQRPLRPTKLVMAMLHYSRSFTVPVPVDSLDVTDEGEIDFSERSMETLNSALSKFFTACVAKVQSDLHALTISEVIREYAELSHYGYAMDLRDTLTWRGRSLNEVSAGTKVRVGTFKLDGSNPGLRSAYWNLGNIPYTNCFNVLINHQTASEYNDYCKPEYVFILKTVSNEEYELAKTLLKRLEIVEGYLAAARPEMQNATFFLCQKGDPLEEWIEGEVLSVEEFAQTSEEERKRALSPTLKSAILNPGKHQKVPS